MKIDELKAELNKLENGCGSLFIDENGNDAPCKLLLVDRVEPEPHFCLTCQAKIEYLKKGISACEEILNSQQTKLEKPNGNHKDVRRTGERINQDKTADNEQEKVSKSVFYPNDNSEKSPVQTQFSELEPKKCFYDGFDKGMEFGKQQALSQRNKEILEILNKYKNTFCDLCEEDYQKLKKQLTTKEEAFK